MGFQRCQRHSDRLLTATSSITCTLVFLKHNEHTWAKSVFTELFQFYPVFISYILSVHLNEAGVCCTSMEGRKGLMTIRSYFTCSFIMVEKRTTKGPQKVFTLNVSISVASNFAVYSPKIISHKYYFVPRMLPFPLKTHVLSIRSI